MAHGLLWLATPMRWTPIILGFAVAGPLAAPDALAQEVLSPATKSRQMTLAEGIAYARAHQPAVLASLARVTAQKEAARVPRAQWQPTFGATAQLFGATANNSTALYVTQSQVDIPRIGGTPSTSGSTWQPQASTFVGAGVRQEAFDFGRIAAQVAEADDRSDVLKQASAGTTLDVTYSVEETYFAVYAAKAVLTAASDAYTRAKAHRDLAKSGVDSGMRSPIELTRAEADLARFDAAQIRARGGVTEAESVFAAAVGVPDLTLGVAGAPTVAADLPSLEASISAAGARDPRILQALAELRTQEQATRAVGAQMRPNLYASGTISGRAGGSAASSGEVPDGNGWVPNVPNWDVGLVLAWPLFDPTIVAQKAASRAVEQVRREELAQTRFQEVAAIRQAYVAAQVARAALPALQQALDAGRANFAQADARFRAGLGTAVELADAEALLADAEIQLALGTFEVARTRAVFGRTIAEGL